MKTMCPDPGDLRRAIDEPDARVTAHLLACTACARASDELGANARFAASAIGGLDDDARARIPRAVGRMERDRVRFGRPLVRAAAVAVAAMLAVGTIVALPDTRGAAAALLAQFRGERFAAVPLSQEDASRIEEFLHVLGSFEPPAGDRFVAVSSVSEASGRVGFPIAVPPSSVLPAGISGPRRIEVQASRDLRVHLDRERIARYIADHGSSQPVPTEIEGTTLVLQLPPIVLMQFGGAGSRQIVIGQSRIVEVATEGPMALQDLRAYLLGLPGLPPAVAQRLRAIDDWTRTLPIPIPLPEYLWRTATVNGIPALVVSDAAVPLAGVIWQRDGFVHGVGGDFPEDEILRIATALG